MKKFTFLLLAMLFAAVALSAQDLIPVGPQKASKFGSATCAADLCGVYQWTYQTANRRTAQPDTLTAEGSRLATITNKRVIISLLDAEKDSVLIWGMFEEPLHAFVSIQSGYYPQIRIPTGQVTQYHKNYGKITLNVSGYSNGTLYGYSYCAVNVRNNYLQVSNWLNEMIVSGTYANQALGYVYYITGSQMSEYEYYKDYNALMYITYDKALFNMSSYYEVHAVNVSQDGNTVQVQNFLGNGKTLAVDLHADNSISIENQIVRTYNNVDYTLYPATGATADKNNPIIGTGNVNEVSWGNFRYENESGSGYSFASGKIQYLDNVTNQFHYPVALTMTDAGWASFSSEKALSFVGTGLTPYAVTSVDETNGAMLQVVDVDVEAHTGLFLKGAADDYEIPTVAEGRSVEGNQLKATSNATVTGNGNIYALGKDATTGAVGLQKVKSGTTIATNKAYLELNAAPAGAKSFIPFFFGGTTAIKPIDNSQFTIDNSAPAYNLAGQRVGENYRGIVVRNGKKYVKQ